MNRIIVLVFFVALGNAVWGERALANNIVVNSTADSGSACTLRNAIQNANDNSATNSGCAAGGGADTITFDSGVFSTPQTITLGSALPLLTDSATTTIDGGNVVTVDGNNSAQVFGIGFTSPSATAILRNLTVARGTTDGYGGGVFMSGATLELDHVTLNGNQALYGGGGLWTQSGITTINNCIFTGNGTSTGSGGGIGNASVEIHISNSTFTANSAGSGGAGIFTGYGGTITITNSTFSGNTTSYYGSAIRNFSSDPMNATTTLTLDYVTIVGNSTDSGYGALDAETNASNTISNSIVAGNTGGDCNGTVSDQGNNFFGNNSCGRTGNGDPQLAPLGYTGGLTPTMQPLPGSPVIDAATCEENVPADQRGVPRPQNLGCDMGAVEVEKSLFANGFELQPI